MNNIKFAILFVCVGLLLDASTIYSLEVRTHETINQRIAEGSFNGFSLDIYLKNNLGFTAGNMENLNGKETRMWVRDGGRYEDVPYSFTPYVRSVNHFHGPLTDQGYNGFWGTGIMSGMSSTQWALLPQGTQSTFCLLGCYSWYDVRNHYYQALTSVDKTTRENFFAQTFRGVGQLMHLIEDVSVPSHTRNDGHLFYNYENYAESYINEYGVPTSSVFFSGTINNMASFIDTNQYNGPSPDPNIAVGTNIGISEYTNANFFSDDTINSSNFPYPDINQTTVTERLSPSGNYQRQYYLKNCCGETNGGQGYLLSAVDYLDYYRQQYPALSFALPKIPVLDDNVYTDYASLLIPRAVGYSAGLLNYFFRGTLEITKPDENIYSIIDGSVMPQQFIRIKAKVRNSTPDTMTGEEVQGCDIAQQNCMLQAVAKYKIRPNYMDDLSSDPPIATEMQGVEFSYSVSDPVYIASLSSSIPQDFIFNFTNNPIPVGITDLYLQVIFKGTLGNETDIAVAAGMVDMNEPQHFSIWNSTDMFYLDGVLRTADEIRNTPSLLARVDFDGDGIVNETAIGEPYIDPYDVTTYVAFYSATISPTLYNATYTPLPSGRYGRIIMLSDMPDFYMRVHRESITPPENLDTDLLSSGVTNQENNGTFENTQVNTFRGIIQHQWTAYVRYYPDSTGISTALWPVPAIIDPYPADAVSP